MKNRTLFRGCPQGGIVMLLVACVAVGANAATVVQTPQFLFHPRTTNTQDFTRTSFFKFMPGSMACMAVSWALFFRRRSH